MRFNQAIITSDMRCEDALRVCTDALRQASVPHPRVEARLLLQAALELSFSALVMRAETPLDEGAARLRSFLRRRLKREPFDRIIGEKEFFSLKFMISPYVLSPRPETEGVVLEALGYLEGLQIETPRILDLGCGSGVILISLLVHHSSAAGVAADASPEALALARRNARRHCLDSQRIAFCVSNWFASIEGRYALIVSNPPYVPTPVIASLEPETANYDPQLALDGGVDGLDAYRILARDAGDYLRPGGRIIVEIGLDQSVRVAEIFESSGFYVHSCVKDLAGIPRVLAFQWNH